VVNGTGSGLCPVAGLDIRSVEPLGSATRELIYIVRRFLIVSVLLVRVTFLP
jgi:hypothetical protein